MIYQQLVILFSLIIFSCKPKSPGPIRPAKDKDYSSDYIEDGSAVDYWESETPKEMGGEENNDFVEDATNEKKSSAPCLSSEFGIVDVSGINPLTEKLWAPGDPYRLAFISSKNRTAESKDAKDYNFWAKDLAAKAKREFARVNWYALGSYLEPNTKDVIISYAESTHMVPGKDPDSPVYRMDGELFSRGALWGENKDESRALSNDIPRSSFASSTLAALNIDEFGKVSECGDTWVSGLGGIYHKENTFLSTGVGRCTSFRNYNWLMVAGHGITREFPLYVFSQVLEVKDPCSQP